jgi:hypothetical protein
MRMPQVSERIKEAPAQALRGVFAGIGQLLLITDKLRHKTPAHPEAPQAAEPPQAAGAPRATGAPQTAEAPEAAKASEAAKAPEAAEAPEASAPEPSPAPEPSATAASGTRRGSGKTGNVRLLPGEAGGADLPAAEVGLPAAEAGLPAVEADMPAAESDAPAVEADLPAAEAGLPAAEAAGAGEPPAEQVSAEAAAPQPVAPLPNYDELTIASLRARLRNLNIDQVRELAEYERAHAARPEVITMFERRAAKLEAGA